jgi:hypothetical protein
MAVTNLTGYTWVGVEGVNSGLDGEFNLNFTSNGNNYTLFKLVKELTYIRTIIYNSTDVYSYGEWNEAYKTIIITGGDDVTDATLISWLENNGTLTPPATPSIADKLLAVNQIKQDIKEAIENKGVDLTEVPFTEYADKISALPIAIELTQEEYDELESYDENTYYIIVEE